MSACDQELIKYCVGRPKQQPRLSMMRSFGEIHIRRLLCVDYATYIKRIHLFNSIHEWNCSWEDLRDKTGSPKKDTPE